MIRSSFLLFLLAASPLAAQDDLLDLLGEEETGPSYTTASFKATRVVNGHSLENTAHGVLDFRIGHRFGFLNGGVEQFFGLGGDRVRVVWNGIDHERFQPGDPAAAAGQTAARWRLDRPYFLYVSRLEHPAKNHARLIEAFARFKAATGSDWLLALGGSDWHGAEAIHAAAAASPCRADIRFLGFVDDASLPDLYRAAACFVYPSLFEGFGFPPIEAMACGCPVISSARGSLREVVADAARLVDPESVPELAEALTALATGAPARDQLRVAGFRNARRFDWNRNAAETLEVYAKACRRKKA